MFEIILEFSSFNHMIMMGVTFDTAPAFEILLYMYFCYFLLVSGLNDFFENNFLQVSP